MDSSVFNRAWAKVILEALNRYGVTRFCIAPGSRSTPLTLEALALQKARRARCYTHFDERGLGFLALGLTKAQNAPVAVIVTSGTAVANLYPALIEARMTHQKVIFLTADRPPELINRGANQAIPQADIFADFPHRIALPRPSEALSPAWLASEIEHACQTMLDQQLPLHINVPFAEPLYGASDEASANHAWLAPLQTYLSNPDQKWLKQVGNNSVSAAHDNWDYWRTKRGVIVVGNLPKEQNAGIESWAEELGWVLISDVQSGINPPLPHADIWLSNPTVQQKLLQADIVVQFGGQLVSKRVNQFLEAFQGEYWLIDAFPEAQNPFAHRQTRFVTPAHKWLHAHPATHQRPWLLEPLALSKFCHQFIEQQIGNGLNEAGLAQGIGRLLKETNPRGEEHSQKMNVFIGNSLFVRLVDALCVMPSDARVFTNRGVSGIDGLVATVAGLGRESDVPVLAFLGDISSLHDLNSFALLKHVNVPTMVFVINNSGGAIFDMLPVEDSTRNYYRIPHNLDFSQISAMFGLNYARPFTWADLTSVRRQALLRRETTVIEIKVNATDGSNLYKQLLEQIARAELN